MTETTTPLEEIKYLLAKAEVYTLRWMPGSAYEKLTKAMNQIDLLDGKVDAAELQALKDERHRLFDLLNFGE